MLEIKTHMVTCSSFSSSLLSQLIKLDHVSSVQETNDMCRDEAILTVSISPSHLAHSMDKMTRANDNGDCQASSHD
jgi:hypothetical protein